MAEIIPFGSFYKTDVYCSGEVYVVLFSWYNTEGQIFCQKCGQKALRVIVNRAIGITDSNNCPVDPKSDIGREILKNLQAELDDHSDLIYFPKNKLAKPNCHCSKKRWEQLERIKSSEPAGDHYEPQHGQPKA